MRKLIQYLIDYFAGFASPKPISLVSDRWLAVVGSSIEFEEPSSYLENLLGVRK